MNRKRFPAAGNGRWHPGKLSEHFKTAAGTQGSFLNISERSLAPREAF